MKILTLNLKEVSEKRLKYKECLASGASMLDTVLKSFRKPIRGP